MSIVLVIIGLIVGGILVGQSLIAAAAVRAQISQIEKYNTAVNTFRDKYGGLWTITFWRKQMRISPGHSGPAMGSRASTVVVL